MRKSNLFASVACLALSAAITAPASAQRVVVFGDSLSDTGNAQILTSGVSPGSPLGRYSNGLNWVDLLYGTVTPGNASAYAVGAFSNTIPTGNVIDYAVGGAFAGVGNIASPLLPGVTQEVGLYAQLGGKFTAADTVTMWSGANNGNLAVQTPGATTTTISTAALSAAKDEFENLKTLISLGARKVIVLNVPELGGTPALINAGPSAVSAGNFYSQSFNGFLSGQLQGLAAGNTSVNIIQADIASLFKLVSANPAAFGFTSTTTACLYTGGAACNGLAFADTSNPLAAIHPTQAANAFIAQYIGLLTNTAPAIAQSARLSESSLYVNELVTNQAFDRLSAFVSGTYADRNGPYAELIGSYGTYNGSNGTSDLTVQFGGVRAGIDKKDGATLTGGSVSLITGSQSAGAVKSDLSSYRFDVYTTALFGNLYVSADAGIGSLSLDGITRQTGIPTSVASGSTSGYVATAAAEVGIAQQIGAFTVIPSGRLTYFHSQLDGYSESSEILALSYSDQQSDTLLAGGKVRVAANVPGFGLRATGFGEIGYEGVVSSNSSNISSSLVNNTALPTVVKPGDANGPGIIGKLGLSSEITAGTFLDLQYGISVHDQGGETHSGDIRLKATY
jgi:outer membrane lipase/esterase